MVFWSRRPYYGTNSTSAEFLVRGATSKSIVEVLAAAIISFFFNLCKRDILFMFHDPTNVMYRAETIQDIN